MLLKQYKDNLQHFTIRYQRPTPSRISQEIEDNILKELSIEKKIIQNKEIPLKSYNYNYTMNIRLIQCYRHFEGYSQTLHGSPSAISFSPSQYKVNFSYLPSRNWRCFL
jgi:hypothetical protein